MDEILSNDTGYVQRPPRSCNPADFSLILEVCIHVPGYGKENLEYGTHSKIKKNSGSPDIGGVLGTEFRAQKGKIIVSRKSHPSTLTPFVNRV
jgi:hypothetical protein